jgi:hypothetical protein
MSNKSSTGKGSSTVLQIALAYLRAGISVVPIPHGLKWPTIKWGKYASGEKDQAGNFVAAGRLPTEAEARRWFDGPDPPGIGAVCGAVSGNLELLDFDMEADSIFPTWSKLVEAELPGLVARLNITRTPGGGYHVRYRCSETVIPGNDKLAGDPDKEPPADSGHKEYTLVETRGEGGQGLAPGTPAKCHPLGRLYEHHSGPPLTELPTITAAEREVLIRCARSFDREPVPEEEAQGSLTLRMGEAPGDAYCRRGPDWKAILEPHGWRLVRTADGKGYWRRPGKEGPGWSATTGLKSKGNRWELLCVFSSNAAPFPGPSGGKPCSSHNKFSAYALLNHNGDFGAAAKALAALGYGDQRQQGNSTPASARSTPPRPKLLPAYQPFPVNALPAPLCDWSQAVAAALGCDASFPALPALSALAGAIGNTRVILLKRGWTEPAIVWTCIIGESGTLKSPAHEQAVIPMYRAQDLLRDIYDQELEKYREAKAKGESVPERPALRRVMCSDITVEKLAGLLEANPRGVLVSREELAGWLGSFTRYKGKSGGTDLPNWLEMHRAGTVIVDRKTGDPPTLYIKRAAVSICGGIQPHVVARALTSEHFDAGLVARLWLAMPPRGAKVWSEAVVSDGIEKSYHKVFETLLNRRYDRKTKLTVLHLDQAAKPLWVDWYNAWAAEQAAAEGEMAATLAKLEGGAARLALLHHVATMTHLEKNDCCAVGVRSMEAGITLARWFADEARRVMAMLGETEQERTLRCLLEFIRARGGSITARQLQRANCRKYRTADDATAALDTLIQAGLGEWVEKPTTDHGGCPTRTFNLRMTHDTTDTTSGGLGQAHDTTADTTPQDSENSCVSDSSVSCVMRHAQDECGEQPSPPQEVVSDGPGREREPGEDDPPV